jgi:hypothetical protein
MQWLTLPSINFSIKLKSIRTEIGDMYFQQDKGKQMNTISNVTLQIQMYCSKIIHSKSHN